MSLKIILGVTFTLVLESIWLVTGRWAYNLLSYKGEEGDGNCMILSDPIFEKFPVSPFLVLICQPVKFLFFFPLHYSLLYVKKVHISMKYIPYFWNPTDTVTTATDLVLMKLENL